MGTFIKYTGKGISSWEKKRVKSMPDTGGKSYKRKVGLIPRERSRVECLAKKQRAFLR